MQVKFVRHSNRLPTSAVTLHFYQPVQVAAIGSVCTEVIHHPLTLSSLSDIGIVFTFVVWLLQSLSGVHAQTYHAVHRAYLQLYETTHLHQSVRLSAPPYKPGQTALCLSPYQSMRHTLEQLV